MSKRNWKVYNKNLVQRGNITFFVDPKLLTTKPIRKRVRGRPLQFSDQAIMMILMIKINFSLPYRALEGFMTSLLTLMQANASSPTYTLICKRAKSLKQALPPLSSRRPSVVILDASGVKVVGEGEWKIKVHGKQKRRRWLKVHIGIDSKTQEIVAESTTESRVTDGEMTTALLDQVKGCPKLVLADGGYDGRKSRKAIEKKGAKALIPPPKNGRLKNDHDRDDALRMIRGFGGGKQGRSLWGKLTGYNMRVLVESAFSRMKRLFGERLFSKTFDRQEVENRLRCLLMNKLMNCKT